MSWGQTLCSIAVVSHSDRDFTILICSRPPPGLSSQDVLWDAPWNNFLSRTVSIPGSRSDSHMPQELKTVEKYHLQLMAPPFETSSPQFCLKLPAVQRLPCTVEDGLAFAGLQKDLPRIARSSCLEQGMYSRVPTAPRGRSPTRTENNWKLRLSLQITSVIFTIESNYCWEFHQAQLILWYWRN